MPHARVAARAALCGGGYGARCRLSRGGNSAASAGRLALADQRACSARFHGLYFHLFLQTTGYSAALVLAGAAIAEVLAIALLALVLSRIGRVTQAFAPRTGLRLGAAGLRHGLVLPAAAELVRMWGRLSTCGRLAIGHPSAARTSLLPQHLAIHLVRRLAEQHEDHLLHPRIRPFQMRLHFPDRDLRRLLQRIAVHPRADRRKADRAGPPRSSASARHLR